MWSCVTDEVCLYDSLTHLHANGVWSDSGAFSPYDEYSWAPALTQTTVLHTNVGHARVRPARVCLYVDLLDGCGILDNHSVAQNMMY